MHASTISTSRDNIEATGHALVRNTQYDCGNELPPAGLRQPSFTPLKPPVVAAQLLTRGEIGFLEFLADPEAATYCELLLGSEATSAATILWEFRKATEFHYFGYRRAKPGSKNPDAFGLAG